MTTAVARQCASPEQVADLKELMAQLEARGDDCSRTRQSMNAAWLARQFDVGFAATVIASMLDRLAVLDARDAAPVVPDGRYAVPAEAGHWAFYRVWNGDYAVCVWLQVSDDERRVAKASAKSVLAKIADIGPLEAAKEYGRQIGVCGVCSRTLTNPDSIAAGIGPVCASRF